MKSIHQLDYKVAVKDDQPGDVEAKKDWGVSVVEEEGISPALKKAMMEAVLSVDKVKLLATEERDEFFSSDFYKQNVHHRRPEAAEAEGCAPAPLAHRRPAPPLQVPPHGCADPI